MKSKLKTVLSVGLITGILSLGAIFTAWAADEDILAQGTSGDITWKLDNTGLLTLEGTGDYETSATANYLQVPPWYEYRENIKSAEVNISGITNADSMFYECSNLKSINMSNFDTSNVTSMRGMFAACSSLTDLDVSGFNTSNVRAMTAMFKMCSNLINLDVSNFNTSNVTDMNEMFDGCSSLTDLDVSNFNTLNVTNMDGMFNNCSSLTRLDVSNFNTSNVSNISRMFNNCSSLTHLDLSNFDVSNCYYIGMLLDGCSNLQRLNTPVNVRDNITSNLPESVGGDWYIDGTKTQLTYLPNSFNIDSTMSWLLVKGYISISNQYDIESPTSVTSGDTLTAIITSDKIPNDVYYMWVLEDDDKLIIREGKTIIITDELIQTYDLAGRKIYCIVESNTDKEFKLSSEMIEVIKTVVNLDNVNLVGETTVGKTLTANVEPSDATVSYSWYVSDSADAADWTKIEGADKETYTLTALEIGKFIKVVVEGTGNYEGRKEVISNDKVNAKDFTVSINEANTIGETVEVSVEPSDTPVIIEWFRGDSKEGPWTKVEGEADYTYTLTDEDTDKFIKAVVTGTGDYEGEKEAISINAIKTADNINKNIKLVVTNEDTGETSSSAKAGDTLVADIIEYDVLPDDVSYMWVLEDDDKLIIREGKTIIITDDLAGRRIYCIVESKTDKEFKLSSEMILVKAADKTETNSAECNVIVSQGQSFSVTIPAFISMNGEKNVANEADFYTVVVADIAGGDTIEVKPVKLNVVLSQAGKRDLEAEISTEDGWNYEISKNGVSEDDLSSGVKRNHKISVAKLSAGRWRGTFNWSITTTGEKIKDSEEYVEYRQFDSATNEWKGLGRQ